jgi:hypothetical protein
VLFQVLEKDPEPPLHWVPALPPPLVAILDRALRKNPDDRFGDAGEMLDAVRNARETIPPETAMLALSPADRTSPTLAVDAPRAEPSSGARRSRWASHRPSGAASDPRSRSIPAPVTAAPPAPTLLGRSPTRVEAQRTVSPQATVAPAAAGRGPWVYAVAAVVLVVAGGALSRFLATDYGWRTHPPGPSAAPPSAVAIELAQRSLDAKDYNRALDQAEQALRLDPTSTEARRLMELARSGLAAQTARADVTPAPTAPPPTVKASPSPVKTRASTVPPPTAPPTVAPYSPPPTTVVVTTTLPPPSLAPPPTTPPTTVAVTVPPTTVAPPPVVNEDLAVRHVIAEYGRAIEEKDLGLFKRVYPGLSPEAEKRLRDAFQAGSQTVRITIGDVQISGAQATVRVTRQDTIDGQSRTFPQTFRLTKGPSGWIIHDIGK